MLVGTGDGDDETKVAPQSEQEECHGQPKQFLVEFCVGCLQLLVYAAAMNAAVGCGLRAGPRLQIHKPTSKALNSTGNGSHLLITSSQTCWLR